MSLSYTLCVLKKIPCMKQSIIWYSIHQFQLFIFLRKSSREIIFPVDCILILKQFEMFYPSSDV